MVGIDQYLLIEMLTIHKFASLDKKRSPEAVVDLELPS